MFAFGVLVSFRRVFLKGVLGERGVAKRFWGNGGCFEVLGKGIC
jgi:hypothetical protein